MKKRLHLQRKHIKLIGIILLILILPITLILVKTVQDQRSSAAAPDKLETETGVLSSSGVTKQTDSGASGGSYVLFNKQITTSTPEPTSPPSSSKKVYGPGIIARNKGNIEVHEAGSDGNGQEVGYRFRAEYGGIAKYIRAQWKSTPCCDYGSGDGGTYRVGIQSVDSQLKPSGIWLDYVDNWRPGIHVSTIVQIQLSGNVTLEKGKYYAVIWRNTHPNQVNNHGSLNQAYKPDVDSPIQPYWPDDETVIYMNGPSNWKINSSHVPSFDLEYTSGKHEGAANIIGSDWDFPEQRDEIGIVNNSSKGRWSFTYPSSSSPITANAVNVYLQKVTGSTNATVDVRVNGASKATGILSGSGSMAANEKGWRRASLTQPINIFPGSTVEVFFLTSSGEFRIPVMLHRDKSPLHGSPMGSYPYSEGNGSNIHRADDGPNGTSPAYPSWYEDSTYGTYFELQ